MARLVIDPVTRIEGHLRVEVQVGGGRVTEAYSSATMWRGIETIVQGRDPRDAWLFAQRICGVCTTVHALASVRAVEDAIGAVPPLNARLLRQLIAAAQYVHDHVVHFYHLQALDWIDPTSALKADPAQAARSRSPSPTTRVRRPGCSPRSRPGSRRSWQAAISARSPMGTGGMSRTGSARSSTCSRSATISTHLTSSASTSGCTRSSAGRTRTRRRTSSAAWPLPST